MFNSKSCLSLIFSATLIFLSSCEKEENLAIPLLEGEYEGLFTVEYNNGSTFSNPVTITFSEKSYACSTGENLFPAGGEGSFEIGNDRITFSDTNYYTANFDWNLLLSGEYRTKVSQTEIILTAEKNGLGVYTYRMNLQ